MIYKRGEYIVCLEAKFRGITEGGVYEVLSTHDTTDDVHSMCTPFISGDHGLGLGPYNWVYIKAPSLVKILMGV